MSNSSPDIAGLISQASDIQFFNFVTISGAALYIYDYTLTLPTEIAEIWNSKFSGAQALFYMTRYSFMVLTVLYCVNNLVESPSETVIEFNLTAWVFMSQVGLYGILTLRTYAIYQKNPFILVTVGLTGVANVAVALSGGVLEKPEVDSSVFGPTCDINPPSVFLQRKSHIIVYWPCRVFITSQLTVQLASTILSLILDVLVFTLTFAKTIHHAIEMRKLGLGNGLGYFILRDGTIAKLLIGVVGTVIFFVPASDAIGNWISLLPAMGNPLTIVLINRLVLNLRQVSHKQQGNALTISAMVAIQEPAFAANSLLGNLGAPLRVGSEDDDEIEELGIDFDAEVVEERGSVDHSEIIEEFPDPCDV
ncbi:hypothetical protein BD410DRAFT_846053 [Rickenella mellea]|uniref:DUF6533 domain-containing protein n=1 Tax=Rickenella mellea TaxID=50990 RepID=A0A4Y7PHC1_9AGAM|nr:hypothetical protein BD410DRAFT_846053 [Rickenella mellea]